MQLFESELRKLISEELLKTSEEIGLTPKLSEGILWHLREGVTFETPVYRAGTQKYFALIREARQMYKNEQYLPQSVSEREMLESDLGEWGMYEGALVPLDFPFQEGSLTEAQYKGKEVELNKPKKGGGGKSYVYVRNPETGNVKKVSFGSSMPDAMGDSPAAKKRRKSFGDRHDCANKKDKTQAGYWSCRATKFFGRDIPGWW